MTTKVTIEVPDGVEYQVIISTNSQLTRGNSFTALTAGAKYELYLHSGLRITGIEELPLDPPGA